MRKRLLIGATVAMLTAAVALLGGVLREAGPAAGGAAGSALAVSPERALAGFSLGDTGATVARLEEEVRNSGDARSLALLGLAYQQRARETADSSYLARSERALRRALRADGSDDPLVLSGLASLAASRHDFRESLRLSRRVVALAPDTARGYGLLGDSLLELGRYDEAFAAFDKMVDLKPSLSGYARIAYARELIGRPRRALEAMELALEASGNVPEPTAWTLVEIGKLHFSLGELREAGHSFRAALAAFPGYVYALDGLAKVEAARGHSERALKLARQAADSVPLPQLVGTLADLHRSRGETKLAEEQIALIATIERLLAANGVNSDLELALFRVDHGIRLRETLALARAARAGRPTIYGDDVLAWALARNGRCGDALPLSERSLRLGTKDASLYFHRGMIERCLGHDAAAKRWFARAVETNPHFSPVWAPTARRLAK